MLYRHLPKIANKDFSILASAFGPFAQQTFDSPESLAISIAAQGISLIWLENDTGGKLPADFPGTALVVCPVGIATSGDSLAAWLGNKGARARDFAVIDFTQRNSQGDGTGHIDPVRATLAANSAKKLVSAGLIEGFGFRIASGPNKLTGTRPIFSENDSEALTEMGTAGDWAFWSTDYNLVTAPSLDPLVRELGNEGIPLVATDPFAGGILSGVPPAVHELYFNAPVPRAHEEWALRAIWENQDVLSVVAPASTIGIFEKRCIFAGTGRPNSLPERELEVIRAAAKKLLT